MTEGAATRMTDETNCGCDYGEGKMCPLHAGQQRGQIDIVDRLKRLPPDYEFDEYAFEVCGRAADEIIRLRTELAAVRAPGDETVADLQKRLTAELILGWGGSAEAITNIAREAVTHLVSLSASYSAACGERDEARDKEACERELRNHLDAENEQLTAQLSLALVERDRARTDALEEAAKVVEAIADDRFREHGHTEPDTDASYYAGSLAAFYEVQDEENVACAAAIRALKEKEPQT